MAEPLFFRLSHDEFLACVTALREGIEGDRDWRPNFLVGIGRGGLVPATYLSHATGISMLSVDVSARVPQFVDELLVKLAARTHGGERLLFVDDINDTGGTVNALRAALTGAGAVAERIRFAVLIDNVRSSACAEYRARTIDRSVTKDWFVFPWEAVASQGAIMADAAEVPARTA